MPIDIEMPPNKPKCEDDDFSELGCHPQVAEELLVLQAQSNWLAAGQYDVKVLLSIMKQKASFPEGSQEHAELQDAEDSMRSILERQPIGHCRQDGKETAQQAVFRSVGECMDFFGPMILNQAEWYKHIYLYSEHWNLLRSEVIALHHGRCHDCGKTPKKIQVHHVNYRSIFDVTADDLQPLCGPCHRNRHIDERGPTLHR